jgi:23S rRNA pseudouridine2605 synthase
MRLNRYLALCGLGSRRKCEDLITGGQVSINGNPVIDLAVRVADGDVVQVNDRVVSPPRKQAVLLHKPRGVLCTKSDPKGRETIYDLLPPHLKTLHYVGRLDSESEGLLLLTNDGDLTQTLTHPSHEIEKEYAVTLNRPFREMHVDKLLRGIPLEEGIAFAVAVHQFSPRRMSMILRQGMNRQVRRMFEALEYEVERLVRVRIGGLTISDLKLGRWRILQPAEISLVQQRTGPSSPGRRPGKAASAESSGAAKAGKPLPDDGE